MVDNLIGVRLDIVIGISREPEMDGLIEDTRSFLQNLVNKYALDVAYLEDASINYGEHLPIIQRPEKEDAS